MTRLRAASPDRERHLWRRGAGHHDRRRGRRRRGTHERARNDGISFASLTFVSKIMNALAVLVFGFLVVIAGYQDGVAVTPTMQNTIFLSITIVPALSCLASAVPFLFYRLHATSTVHGRMKE